ncbi:MAG: aminotransferase class V-fold PLP-dependent enzyme [Halanaeroarchaeum sp.]
MDLADLRADVPALDDDVYCNWGASGPSPRRVVEAMEGTLEYHEYESAGSEGMYPYAFSVVDDARESVASLLGTDPDAVALTQSTTDAINRVATAIDWSPGDEVVVTDLEHSAGRLPWRRLERDVGIEVTVLETDDGVVDLDEFATAVADARLACFSAVDWLYGRRHSVEEMVDVAREADTLTLVDAVQVPGQLPIDVEAWGADVVAGAGHKWLLGPWGAGFLYVRPTLIDRFHPAAVGYRSVEDPNDADIDYAKGSRRFEIGTTSPAPYAGLVAAIETVRSVGMDAVTSRIRALTARFKDGIDDDRLLSPRAFHSGLVSVRAEDPAATVDTLAESGVQIRALPRDETVRVSLHAINTPEDVEAVLAGLQS